MNLENNAMRVMPPNDIKKGTGANDELSLRTYWAQSWFTL